MNKIKCIRQKDSSFIHCVFAEKCLYFIHADKNKQPLCVDREKVYKFLETGEWVKQPSDSQDALEATSKGMARRLMR